MKTKLAALLIGTLFYTFSSITLCYAQPGAGAGSQEQPPPGTEKEAVGGERKILPKERMPRSIEGVQEAPGSQAESVAISKDRQRQEQGCRYAGQDGGFFRIDA